MSTADSIRHLTRAYIGARVYQGLLFCFVVVHNINAALIDVGYRNPRLQMWVTLGAIVAVGTVGTYYGSRFGRVEAPRPSLLRQVARATAFALFLMAIPLAILVAARLAPSSLKALEGFVADARPRPMELMWLLLSAGTATSLATSLGERLGWVLPLLASVALLVTLVVPALQPYRALGHAGMAVALVVTAVQLHLFLMRGFRVMR